MCGRCSGDVRLIWILDNELAHTSYPSLDDLEMFYTQGVRAVVALQVRDDADLIQDIGFAYCGVYVDDFTAPTIDQLEKINAFIDSMRTQNKPVLVHCIAAGRSGTALVAYPLHCGMRYTSALKYVRDKLPFAVETHKQLETLKQFAAQRELLDT